MTVKRYEPAVDKYGDGTVIESQQGDFIPFDDYAAAIEQVRLLTEQRDALVVENVAMKSFRKSLEDIRSSLIGGGHGYMAVSDMQAQNAVLDVVFDEFDEIDTPATDAAIAALRAEGVEMLLTEKFKAEIAGALADFDGTDDATLQTVIWSGQPPEPDGDVWHIEYMTRGYHVQKKIREFARQLRESKGANHE